MNKPEVSFAVIGSVMTIIFFYIINSLYSNHYLWFFYPSFAIIWWPISLYYNKQKSYKEYSVVSSILIIAFLIVTNYTNSSSHPWFLYASFPVIWWPVTMFIGRRASTVRYALFVSLCTIVYYSTLNYLLSPVYPWAIYPSFAVLWWPLSLYFAYRKQYTHFAFAGSLFIILFFIIVNLVSSLHTLWAIYPAFAAIWWPMGLYYASKRQFYKFSVTASAAIILFLSLVNLITSPQTIWAIYPAFGVIWWPLCMYFFKRG